jgi:L-threonylcarbamoyladenylate synthase
MKTEITTDMTRAINALRQGELVALPTETVYGLAADARQPQAIAGVFHAKGRPADHPLIVHIAEISHLENIVSHLSEYERRLMDAFWPGPLTLILPRHPDFSSVVTGGQDWVAVRMPDHPLFLKTLQGLHGPVVAPSANRYESISPTTAEHVWMELNGRIPLILDGGPCRVGIESTIIKISPSGEVHLLRPGSITLEAILSTLNLAVDQPVNPGLTPAVRVSGDRLKHYAPRHPAKYGTRDELLLMVMKEQIQAYNMMVDTQNKPKGEEIRAYNMTVDTEHQPNGEEIRAYNMTVDTEHRHVLLGIGESPKELAPGWIWIETFTHDSVKLIIVAQRIYLSKPPLKRLNGSRYGIVSHAQHLHFTDRRSDTRSGGKIQEINIKPL